MGKILIVNIGPTGYERYGSYPVAEKTDLDPLLERWAQAAADRLVEYQVSALYACPVPGAGETADIIASRFALKANLLPGLDRSDWMTWKGLSPEDAAAMDCSSGQDSCNAVSIKLPFDMTMDELRVITAEALDKIAQKHNRETVAIVSHRALTVVMILYFLHMSNKHYHQIAQDTGAINFFEIRAGVPSALYINDTCHLHGLI